MQQHANDTLNLFPLPLEPFEAMMLFDDWPAYPMTCGGEFVFNGRVDPTAMEAAVQQASERHPLLCAHVERYRGHRWAWVPSGKCPTIRWLDSPDATEYARSLPYDLRAEVGLRIWVHQLAEHARVFFEFHHACCDGAGGLSFVEDILWFYSAAIAGEQHSLPSLPKIDLGLLKNRGRFQRPRMSRYSALRANLTDLRRSLNLLLKPATPLAHRLVKFAGTTTGWEDRRCVSARLGRDVLGHLRSRAASSGGTLNDLLVRDLLLTLHGWNLERQQEHPGKSLRVLVPTNLRTRSDMCMPATNRLSYAFLTRDITEQSDAEHLLHSVRDEMSWLRSTGATVNFVRHLGIINSVPFGLPAVFSGDRCFATAAFSNMGDPTRRFRTRFPRDNGLLVIGNLLLTGFFGITALRPQTRAGILFNTYGNRLTISARFDPAHFTTDDASQFLDEFTQRFQVDSPARTQARAA